MSMHLTHTSLIAAAGFGIVWIAALASCGDSDDNPDLTINATGTTSTGGQGGTSTDGGGGSGADGGGTGATGGSGQGGQGGDPEPVVNGCTSATATDRTAEGSPVNVALPGGSYCMRVSQGATVTFTLPQIGASRYRGGTYDDATQVKSVEASSPIFSCDNVQPFTACPTVNDDDIGCGAPSPPGCIPPFSFPLVGAFPWYDDFAPATIRGVIYVE